MSTTTSTHPLSLTTPPEFPSLRRRRGINISILPNSRNPQFHDSAIFSHRIPNLSGVKSNRFCASSFFAADTSFDVQSEDTANLPQAKTSMWNWKGYSIRYQYSGNSGPALVLVHGFGANRQLIAIVTIGGKTFPFLQNHTVYSIDLIGYGYSDKPNPREFGDNTFYTFDTWGNQINDFCNEVVKDRAYFICNSIGGLVGLQAAIMEPQICRGLLLLNISLRMLHIKKQPWFARPFIKSFQSLPRNTDLGKLFFKSVATSESVRSILSQCYHDTSQVTEELVEKILLPGLEPGAVDVFLDFICYSAGPLPEDLLPQVKCPVLVAWGDKDPWEPIELGRMYGNFDPVQDFVVLPNVGHCPQDEAPHLVNQLVESFVARNSAAESSV